MIVPNLRRAGLALGVCAVAMLLLVPAGCKKKDVAKAVAEQAALEAAEAGNVTNEVTPDEIGVAVYPGARPTGRAVRISIEDGSGSTAQASYHASASLEAVLGFYRDALAGATVSEETSADGVKSASVTRETTTETEVASLTALLSETADGTDISLCAVRRAARFSVYLDSVPDGSQAAVVQAICTWKGIPTVAKDAEVQRQEAQKLMTVLPRPVDVGLAHDKALELRDQLVAAGGQAEVR
jgi:hypothetical protein